MLIVDGGFKILTSSVIFWFNRKFLAMPHVSSGGGDDLGSTDEVKVYNDEGEEEQRSSAENLSEDKLGLVTESEEVRSKQQGYYFDVTFHHRLS